MMTDIRAQLYLKRTYLCRNFFAIKWELFLGYMLLFHWILAFHQQFFSTNRVKILIWESCYESSNCEPATLKSKRTMQEEGNLDQSRELSEETDLKNFNQI